MDPLSLPHTTLFYLPHHSCDEMIVINYLLYMSVFFQQSDGKDPSANDMGHINQSNKDMEFGTSFLSEVSDWTTFDISGDPMDRKH